MKKPLESVHVVKSLVNDREPDNRIDHIGIRMDPAQDAAEQSQAVSNGKQADVLHDISEPVKKKYHPNQEEQMIVTGDHVLRAEVHERCDRRALVCLYEGGITPGHVVRSGDGRHDHHDCQQHQDLNRSAVSHIVDPAAPISL